MTNTIVQLDSNQESFINQILPLFPQRRRGKRGPHPISKKVIVTEIFKLIKFGLGWRNISHSTVCRNYIKECQRRGTITNVFHFLTKELRRYRSKVSIIDSTFIKSSRHHKQSSYARKFRNFCTKLTVEINPDYIPLSFRFSTGHVNDKKDLDIMLRDRKKLPYEILLDGGYDSYQRRRLLRQRGCQARIEWIIHGTNRKKGRGFTFTKEHRRERKKVERYFSWLKSFRRVRVRKEYDVGLFHAFVILVMIFYIWKRKL